MGGIAQHLDIVRHRILPRQSSADAPLSVAVDSGSMTACDLRSLLRPQASSIAICFSLTMLLMRDRWPVSSSAPARKRRSVSVVPGSSRRSCSSSRRLWKWANSCNSTALSTVTSNTPRRSVPGRVWAAHSASRPLRPRPVFEMQPVLAADPSHALRTTGSRSRRAVPVLDSARYDE